MTTVIIELRQIGINQNRTYIYSVRNPSKFESIYNYVITASPELDQIVTNTIIPKKRRNTHKTVLIV